MCRLGLMKEPYLFGKARNGQGCCTVWMFTGWRNYPILYAIWVISGSTPAHVAANFKHDTPSTPSHVTCPFPEISWGNVRFTPVQQHSCVCFARHIATKYIATSGDLSFGSDIGIACILATAVKKIDLTMAFISCFSGNSLEMPLPDLARRIWLRVLNLLWLLGLKSLESRKAKVELEHESAFRVEYGFNKN